MSLSRLINTAAIALAFAVSGATAAPTLVVENGILMGAKNVQVDGVLYDVTFKDGTCVALFSGCDSPSDFLFPTQQTASDAALALLSTVFIDSAAGAFDSIPGLTNGCVLNVSICRVDIPIGVYQPLPSLTLFESAYNQTGPANIAFNPNAFDKTHDSSADPGITFAVFQRAQVAAVPEPESIALVGIGVIGVCIARRRRPFAAALRA